MRRIQLYLEDELWSVLRLRARNEGMTISKLIRVAVRERYFGPADARKIAMQHLVGIRKNRKKLEDTKAYVRRLRHGARNRTIA